MLIRFVKEFWLSITSYYKGIILIYNNWLWLFFLVPIILIFVIYIGGEYILIDIQNTDINESIRGLKFPEKISTGFGFESFEDDSVEMETLLNAMKMIFVIVSMKFSKYLILIALTPVLSILSSKVETILTGNIYTFEKKQFINDIYRGINFSLRNLSYQIFTITIWYLISMIITPLQQLTPYIIFIIGSYYYGSSIIDFTNERLRLSFEQSVAFNWQRKGFTLGIGLVFYGLFYISFVGIVLAPIIATVASTLGIHEMINLKKNKFSIKNDSLAKLKNRAKEEMN